MNLFFTENKLQNQINEIGSLRYRNKHEISNWKVMEDISKREKYPPKDFSKGQPFPIGSHWEGRDYYLWIQDVVMIPKDGINCLVFDFGKTGDGHNSGFESLLFINGEPYQGVDSNHKEVFLDRSLLGKEVTMCLKLWSGLEGGGPEQTQRHHFKQADMVQVDEASDDFYYTAKMMVDTAVQLAKDDPNHYLLLNTVNESMKKVDWSYPGSDDFYQSIQEANHYLQEQVASFDKKEAVTVTAIGHTHIDVAWLWRLKHTREKAARSFSTVLKLMEQYPEYIFLQTQPQLYQYIKEDYPEIYEKIKQKIRDGVWEVDGAMWLEADCNIPSGESLTRQILHGAKFIKEEFDQDIHYLWLPDVFGYSWALPQILKKSNIDTFMTTKISWNQMNRMPHDTFMWKGIDGTEVLTHFITTPVPGATSDWATQTNWFYTYNGELEPETVLGIYRGYSDKDINENLLLSYGYGDGGGGVNRDMLEKRRRMDLIPSLPNVKTGKAVDYFEQLHKTIENTEQYVHTWDGELYLEYHRGTYTSQAYVKKMNRKIELMLRELEILYSNAEINGDQNYPHMELFKDWQTLLRNQFHDIIPGSSIKEVYQDYREEIKEVLESIEQLKNQLIQKTGYLALVNTTGWERTSLVEFPDEGMYQTSTGEMVSTHRVDDKILGVVSVPAFSNVTLVVSDDLRRVEQTATGIEYENGVETDFYRVMWNDSGHITGIYDKEFKRQVLNGLGNVFQLFEDKPMNFDAWDIDIYYQEKMTELTADRISVKENNPLYVSVLSEYRFGQSTIIQEMLLYKHTRRIDFKTRVNWQERQQLLKVKFDANVRAIEATYDIQYGNVKRPTHWNTSWDLAKFETVGHQWADLSQQDYGVSLLNDCKYGYDIKGQQIRLTLLKGGIYPDPTADVGEHEFIYSLLPHEGDFISGKTVEEAWEINQPLSFVTDEQFSLPKIAIETNGSLSIDALKKAEDGEGWIFRCHDHLGATRDISLELPEGFSWQEVNLLEEKQSDLQRGTLQFTLNPYEIQTYRLLKD